MLMRYWWGLGIGHAYCHASNPGLSKDDITELGDDIEEVEYEREVEQGDGDDLVENVDNQAATDEDPELGMDERENEDMGAEQALVENEEFEGEADDETFLAMEEMYGSQAL